AIIENSNELLEQFQTFEQSNEESILIIVIDGRINQQRIHIPFIRQLIDKTDISCNKSLKNLSKFFIILIYSSGQELNYKSCFPSIFLHDWDYWFVDTSTPGSAFHLQKILQIFTSKIGKFHQQETSNNYLYDLNKLFDDCLWNFCSRLQINIHKLSRNLFNNFDAYEFYQHQTTTYRRVQCLKNIFQQINQLQKHIITIYHENILMKEEFLRKNCNRIYDISKDILCGKYFISLVDSLQLHIRISFINFISFILKYIVDDYGLESLTKLSNKNNDYNKLLDLIDYSSFPINYENQIDSIIQEIIILNDHYSCILQTPLFYLCRQRIKNIADDIKFKLIHQQNQFNEEVDDRHFDYYDGSISTSSSIYNNFYNDQDRTANIQEQYRNQLIRSLMNDKILTRVISSSILQSYINDSIRILCTIIEKNFHDNQIQCEKTIDFVSRWLILIDDDDDDKASYNSSLNRNIWQLAHIYTLFEYEQNDILSFYSACRIIENLNQNQSFYNDLFEDEDITRSKVRENLFRLMFYHLWNKLYDLCQTNKDPIQWIHSYTLISKYYPSKQVLQRIEYVHMKVKIEFMNLIYFILLNEKLLEPIKLIQQLLNDTLIIQDNIDNHYINLDEINCLQLLTIIIQIIDQYFKNNHINNSTLMIDIQQWIISILKTSIQSSYQQIIFLLKFLNQSTCYLSLSMKQFLFDELINILIENNQQNHLNIYRQFTSFWDRLYLLSIIIECITNENLENYQIPYHPSIIINKNQNNILIDLYFFHLRRLANNEIIQIDLINKILLSNLPKINNKQQISIGEKIFKQLKDYFLLHCTALLLCQLDLNNQNQQRLNNILITIINQYLIITPPILQLKSKLNTNPSILNIIEIKVMLLLNIYYNYYCNTQLKSLDHLLIIIENTIFQLSDEERRVFRILLKPEQYMIGYIKENNHIDKNYLNNLFKVDCQDDDELPIRHILVNLLAMILLSGKENPFWTFLFQPLKLEETFGFGSTANSPIRRTGVHYDCGCIISETGALVPFSMGSILSVPSVYIVYFATFGAMAWHLLLFESSVQNLYNCILAKNAIDSKVVTECMGGDSIRTKVCHFIRARLLSTYHFLSIQFNQNDACLLLNRCFELFTQFSRQENQNSWIKPIYKTINEKYEAEQEFQNKIFYLTHQKLIDYKKLINLIQTQSPLQTKLQEYIIQMPIIIDFIHFKTELYNPELNQLPLTILRHLLDSFDFLKITRYIYALSQFHILLHRTFTQLIEREEFLTITLKQLYERVHQGSNHFYEINQKNKYYTIIQNGIEAINAYHKFTNGQIRPGACDTTQLFQTISMETPINYLVETDNYDEGDIIMRILSVLVDYHNNLLELLETEIKNHGDILDLGPLKDIIFELSKREISILQIVQENMGIITLNKMDYQWIEQLSRASLENENNYFITIDKSLKFNFLYVQSYLIRTYLLYCRINYQHIKGKYQCYTRKKISIITNDIDMNFNILLIDEWNHLEQKNLIELQNESNLLQQIMNILKNSSENYSSMKLSEFIQNTNYDHRFIQQFQQYQIKDFPLLQIKDICQLYEQSINHFQHRFINVSHLIRVPLDKKLNDELDHILKSSFISSQDQTKKEEFQDKIRIITEFLNDLKDAEDLLASQWSQSFIETCEYLRIENPIIKLIPKEIKCENYVALCLKFIEIRSQLQEQTINIEEKTNDLWNAHFDISNINQSNENRFQIFRNKNDNFLHIDSNSILSLDFLPLSSPQLTDTTTDSINWLDIFDNLITSTEIQEPQHFSSQSIHEEKINYTSLFKLKLTSILLSSSVLFENSRIQAEQLTSKMPNTHIVITYLDGKQERYLCKPEKFYEQLKKIFEKKKYNSNTIVIIDSNQVFIDFMTKTINSSLSSIETEYRIVEKTLLIPIVLEFENNSLKYFVTTEATLTSILSRFILDQQLKFNPSENYFSVFDVFGRYIADDCQITSLFYSNEQTSIHIQVFQCNTKDVNICCEVTLITDQDEKQSQYFNPITTWKQISLWLKILGINRETPIESYNFWNIEQQYIIDSNQTISFILDQAKSIIVDVVNGENLIDIILSYDKNNQNIHILKSCPVYNLLKNPKYLNQLDLKISSQDDYSLVLIVDESEKKILNKLDMENSISHYASMTNKLIHFQIIILIQIIQYDDQKEISISISHRNLTIKQLLEMIEINNNHIYLASYETKMILSENTNLSTINEMKFFLVKEHQTCLITIKQSNDTLVTINEENMENQRYLIDATIDDIYKQNKSIDQNQYLLYDRDFIPSRETSLNLLLCTSTLSIEFNLTYRKFQTNVTVISDEQKTPIRFQCESSMSIGRIHEIVCQLWKLNKRFYRLTLDDDSNVDDDYSLGDISESINDLQLKLISIADVKCAITYQNRIIMISTTNETLLSSILKETLEKLLIPIDDIDIFTLNLMDDPESPTNVDLDLSIDDIHLGFFSESNIIPFQLQKK
ncbi:unnamed protein product, partial [Rotaria sordida]